jgi:glycosyltransferase involved in cell wall biosynthesis
MRLSILICSLTKRRGLLIRLLGIIDKQIKNNADVECLVNTDDGMKTTGLKRNQLIDQAKGDYICFVDDDDTVSDDYVEKILTAAESSPDCIGMEGIITFDGKNPKKFIHSIQYTEWFERNGIYYRNPNHLSPVKRMHAQKVKFPPIHFGEDKQYSMRLLPYLKSEVYIEGPIYFYNYSEKASEANKRK